MDIEQYLVPNSRLGWILYLILFGGMIDYVYYNADILNLAIVIARSFETVITLLFTGLLVIAYWEQQRVLKEQAEISSMQADIQENQLDLMEATIQPDLWFEEWELFDGPAMTSTAISDPYWDRTIGLDVTATNKGQGPAQNIQAEFKFYFSTSKRDSSSFDSFYSFEPFGIRARKVPLGPVSEYSEAMLNQGIGDTLDVRDTAELSAASILSIAPYSGKAEEKDSDDGFGESYKIPVVNADTLGDALDGFYFEVDEVAIEIYVSFESSSGKEYRDLLTRRIAESTEVETVMDLVIKGEWTHNLRMGDGGWLWEELDMAP